MLQTAAVDEYKSWPLCACRDLDLLAQCRDVLAAVVADRQAWTAASHS